MFADSCCDDIRNAAWLRQSSSRANKFCAGKFNHRKSGVKTLESVKVFDVYKGKGVEDGKKSVAFRLTLRHAEKTLNDEDADKAIEKILKKLSADLNIELRK